jgi:hypothetical protein
MSFIRFRLGVGKQVELWDSNVHKDIQSCCPAEARCPKLFTIKVLSFIGLPKTATEFVVAFIVQTYNWRGQL